MPTCEVCKLTWSAPPDRCPNCYALTPEEMKQAAPILDRLTAIRRRNNAADRLGYIAFITMIGGGVLGVASATALVSLGGSGMLSALWFGMVQFGFCLLTSAVLRGISEILRCLGRIEDAQRAVLDPVREVCE